VIGPIRRTKPRSDGPSLTSSYTELARTVKDAGLLRRQRFFYLSLFAGLLLSCAAVFTGMALLGNSWFQLLLAAAFGIIFTQFGFLAHEASHRQVFTSGRANDRLGRLLATALVGMSYSWWMSKHTRHHANPNMDGKDPDVDFDTISFLERDAAKQTGALALLTRWQGYAFFALLIFEGLNLHFRSVQHLTRRERTPGRALELSLIGVRLAVFAAAIFWMLPLGMAAAFLGVQLAVLGIYLGSSFAPNHIGMPIIPQGSRLDFLSKQVLTSRNISGGLPITLLMGGLNLQIEHHLFPSMPRLALARLKPMVQDHCATVGVPYTEATLFAAYAEVIRHLNQVGEAAPDPFDCPVVVQYRRR
jgi:fatty acid desaturase